MLGAGTTVGPVSSGAATNAVAAPCGLGSAGGWATGPVCVAVGGYDALGHCFCGRGGAGFEKWAFVGRLCCVCVPTVNCSGFGGLISGETAFGGAESLSGAMGKEHHQMAFGGA